MQRLSGGLRERTPDEAATLAAAAATTIGITRVTDITRLDQLGVPVFVAVRPTAHKGSLCVSAGKGWTPAEARLGAIMESVEQAWMEPDRGVVPMERRKVSELLGGADDAVIRLCPQAGSLIDRRAEILTVRSSDVFTNADYLVPAELVFHPSPPYVGARYFGSGSNGAAAGSTVDEATLHALVEVIERDVLSFHNVRDHSRPVATASLPAHVLALMPALEAANLELVVRALPSELGLPCFTAIIVDRMNPQLSIRGDGLHLSRDIALSRAVTEAAQCRLTVIHGGRDDLDHFVVRFAKLDEATRARQIESLLQRLAGGAPVVYAGVEEQPIRATVAETLAQLRTHLATLGFNHVLRVVLSPPGHPVAVVRIIVPGLECRLAETRRIGRRLARYARTTS